MTTFHYIFLFLCTTNFAAIIGAYYGTIDYRIRNDEPLISTQCYCPTCKHQLSIWHQIPVLSWLFLKGKCFYCQTSIPVRYPLIESGFVIYYCMVYLLFFHKPYIIIFLWYLFLLILLVVRCKKHYHSMLKGLWIMSIYHFLYSLLLIIILSTP